MKMSICSLVMVVAVVLSAHCAEEENGHGTFYSPVGVSWLGWDIPTEWVPSNSVDGRSDVAGLGLVVFPFGVCGDVHGLLLNTAFYGGQISGHVGPDSDARMNGLSVGAFANSVGVVCGAMVSPINIAYRLNGLQVGVLNASFDACGVMVGLMNKVGEDRNGEARSIALQLGVLNSSFGDGEVSSFDVQIGLWNVLQDGARGLQIGVINQAEGSSVGCSILPVLNARW